MAICYLGIVVAIAAFTCSICSGKGDVFSVEITEAVGNGVVSCRPGVKFPRDCGNQCQCAADGATAQCESAPCPTDAAAFDKANRQVYRDWSRISGEGEGPVFTCKPYSVRKVNAVNGRCFCAKSGTSEICSTRRGSPWGGYN